MAEIINTNLDTTPLPPNNLVAQDPQSAELAGYVRVKTKGIHVREAIARSIELNSTRSKNAEELANETLNVANDLTARYDVQVGALTEDAEVLDARLGYQLMRDIISLSTKTHSTVQSMIVDNVLKAGEIVKTKGYYIAGDKGNATYLITDEVIETHLGCFKLANGLYAKLLTSGYVNVKQFGAKGDGVTDDLQSFKDALKYYSHVEAEPTIYNISDTLNIRNNQSLVCTIDSYRETSGVVHLKYTGPEDRKKAVVLLGMNEVGAEPVTAGGGIIIDKVYADANNLAGFGIYGTYISGDSVIGDVSARNSLEHNVYLAKMWYASVKSITSLSCKNNGITLGAPLTYSDGTEVNWTSDYPLEINNVSFGNIRSQLAGTRFADGSFNHADINQLKNQGYGIKLGTGNSFNISGITSEKSGGVNLVNSVGSQNLRSIEELYLEGTMHYSSVANTELVGMVIDFQSGTGSPIEFSDMFVSYQNGGGIVVTGTPGRYIHLTNVHTPRFIKPINFGTLDKTAMDKYVIKNNVHYELGYYNTDGGQDVIDGYYENINSRYGFTTNSNKIELKTGDAIQEIWVRVKGSVKPHGNITAYAQDGSSTSFSFPANPTDGEWTKIGNTQRKHTYLARGGTSGDTDIYYDLKIIKKVPTYY